MANKKEKNPNAGIITVIVCGLITLALIIGCVAFPDEIFGLFF